MKQNTTLKNQYVLITQTEDRRQTRYILYNARVALQLDSIFTSNTTFTLIHKY